MLIFSLFILTIASVSASDVSDINDNQNYLSENEDSVSDGLSSQYEDLSAIDSDSVDSDSDVLENTNSESNDLSDATDLGSGDPAVEPTKNSTSIVSSSSSVVNGNDYSVTLMDKNGNVLSGKNLIFTFNGQSYARTTDSNGVASLTINAKAGSYVVGVIFEGDELYENSSLSSRITVTKTPTTIANYSNIAVNGKYYYVILKDKNGKALSSKVVTFTFNGKTYQRTTNSRGLANLFLRGKDGNTYRLTYKFAGDEYYAPSSGYVSIKLKKATLFNESTPRVVRGTAYNVILKDSSGIALSKQNVTILLNGRTYTKTSNSRGIVGLTLNLQAGKTYSLTYNYAGSSFYAPSSKTVSVFILTPTKFINLGSTVGQGTNYYVSLRDASGKALSGKTVTITYRGNTYRRTTNAYGNVGLKINSAIGYTYKFTYKFAGDSYYGPSSGSINLRIKKATTLTGSPSTILRGTAYKVTLKDSSGRALSSKQITFNISGNIYKRTTNSNGVASLTINAAAGKTYKFSYIYAGDSYYNRSSSPNILLSVKLSSSIKNSGNSVMNNSSYAVTLKDGDGNALSGKTVSFSIDGNNYQETTDSNGVAKLLVVESSPKTTLLTYKFEGDNVYTASSGSVNLNVKSDKVFTFNQILAASKTLRSYVETHGYLPSTVSVNGISVNITSFAYLMAKSVMNINNGKKIDVDVINISSNYSNNGSSTINADLNKSAYIVLAEKLVNYSTNYERVPNYIDTTIGKMSPNLYIFGLSKALDFYSNNNRLPNYVTFNAKDVDGTPGSDVTRRGNTSQYKKGLNEVQALTSAQLAQYLTSSGNDALNSAIRSLANNLTAGKTTVWAKAEAIFNWVRDNINYEYYADTKYKATGTLSNKRGNCCDHSNLIVAHCRAADIPARYSHGKNCKFSSGLNTGHVWAQIYVDGVWYSADATSSRNKLGNIQNWNTTSFTLHGQYVHLPF